ncbi:armadillo-type protein [Pelomyxa schiedti]|nr:armadillo-type protein [Pelomyxa schiedti]
MERWLCGLCPCVPPTITAPAFRCLSCGCSDARHGTTSTSPTSACTEAGLWETVARELTEFLSKSTSGSHVSHKAASALTKLLALHLGKSLSPLSRTASVLPDSQHFMFDCINLATQISSSFTSPSSSMAFPSPISWIVSKGTASASVICLRSAVMLCCTEETATLINDTLGAFFFSPQACVREEAFRGAMTLHQRGYKLTANLYTEASNAVLEDSSVDVRMQAVRLVWLLGNLYSSLQYTKNNEVSSDQHLSNSTYADDAFSKLCYVTVADCSPSVRTTACKLMGSICGVQLKFVLQAFDKKFLSNKESPSAISGSGMDAQIEKTDISLFLSTAAGAFVHGVEDEFVEVRTAAIDSMCELCMKQELIHAKAIDFLVDMLNDDIDCVRINAISSLSKIGPRAYLSEDQMHAVISAMKDTNTAVRTAIHHMLGTVPIPTITCLLDTVKALISSLGVEGYPEDQDSIFAALKSIALNHSAFTEFIILDLLHVDPRFATKEPRTDDIQYIASEVVALNASTVNPNLISILPHFCLWHAQYLHDKYPTFIPEVTASPAPTTSVTTSVVSRDVEEFEEVNKFFCSSLLLLQGLRASIMASKFDESDNLVSESIRNLKRVSKLSPTLRGRAEFFHFYFILLRYFIKIHRITRQSDLHSDHNTNLRRYLTNTIYLSWYAQNLFFGLPGRAQALLQQITCFCAILIWTEKLVKLADNHLDTPSVPPAIISQHDHIREFCAERAIEEPPVLFEMGGSPLDPKDFFPDYRCFCTGDEPIKQITAALSWASGQYAPTLESDTYQLFGTEGFPTMFSVNALFDNIPNRCFFSPFLLKLSTTTIQLYFVLSGFPYTHSSAFSYKFRITAELPPLPSGPPSTLELQIVKVFSAANTEIASLLETVPTLGHKGTRVHPMTDPSVMESLKLPPNSFAIDLMPRPLVGNLLIKPLRT